MLRKLTICLLATAIVATVVGCRKGPRPDRDLASDEPGPPSPMRDVLIEMHEAMLEGRREDHLATITGDEDEMRVVEALYDFYHAGKEFRRHFIDAYGRGQWEEVHYDKRARLYLPPEDTKHYEHAVIEETSDDTAEAIVIRNKLPLELTLTDDGWRIEASSIIPPGTNLKKAAELTRLWTKIVRSQQERIGREGIRAAEIRTELGDQFSDVTRELMDW